MAPTPTQSQAVQAPRSTTTEVHALQDQVLHMAETIERLTTRLDALQGWFNDLAAESDDVMTFLHNGDLESVEDTREALLEVLDDLEAQRLEQGLQPRGTISRLRKRLQPTLDESTFDAPDQTGSD